MVQRLTYRTRHSYATKSNQHRVVKTPGQSCSFKNDAAFSALLFFIIIVFMKIMFFFFMKVGNWFIRLPRREQVGLSVLLLEREFRV